MFKVIEQTQRFKLVADQIAGSIRSGELKFGQKMPADKDLVKSFQVSRATIREAMIALEMMGYVETKFGSGAFVSKSLPKVVEHQHRQYGYFESVEARYWIESDVAALAALSATQEEVDFMRHCIDKIIEPGSSSEEISKNDRALHLAIAEASRNTVLVSVVELLWDARSKLPKWTRHFNERTPVDKRHYLYSEHVSIIDAIENKDAAGAHEAMSIHCRSIGTSMLKAWHVQESGVKGTEETVVKRLEQWGLLG